MQGNIINRVNITSKRGRPARTNKQHGFYQDFRHFYEGKLGERLRKMGSLEFVSLLLCIREQDNNIDIIIILGMSTSSEKHVASLIEDNVEEARKNRILLTIFVVAVIGFVVLLYCRPPFSNADVFEQVTFPPTAHDLYRVSQVLIEYQTEHFLYSLVVFIYLYTLLQAFAIPGPIFLCVLSPALYGAVGGYFLALSCSCLGASLCYFLSYSLARSLVLRKFPALFHKFHGMVEAHRQNLFWYMLFLRLTPLIPNWFVNLGSPLVGMPYKYFIIASFFGLMPNNFILIQTGLTLKQIDKIGMSPQNFFTLLGLGCLALIPTLFKKKYEKLPEDEPADAPLPKVQ